MRYCLLGIRKSPRLEHTINIGDYIQAVASAQFLPRIDGFMDRDEDLKDYHGEKCRMIMNGWFMYGTANWPPSDDIDPLFVAFHLNPEAKNALTGNESIDYFKRHQPIGCRDRHTETVLRGYGIDAYFSGCMTLTLGRTYGKKRNNGKVFFVDPKVKLGKSKAKSFLKALGYWASHFNECAGLFKKGVYAGNTLKASFVLTAKFLHDYSKVFPVSMLMEATYVRHQSTYYYNTFKTDQELFDEARRLVMDYSDASLVVTSRIHCALPCLGMGTPVIYTAMEGEPFETASRMDGLMELFNIMECGRDGIKPLFNCSLPITAQNHPDNKQTWKPLAGLLSRKCDEFINGCPSKKASGLAKEVRG